MRIARKGQACMHATRVQYSTVYCRKKPNRQKAAFYNAKKLGPKKKIYSCYKRNCGKYCIFAVELVIS